MYVKSGVFNGPKNSYKDVDGIKDMLFKLGYRRNWIKAGLYTYERKETSKREKLAGLYLDLRPKRLIFTIEPLFVMSDSSTIKRNDLGYYVQAGVYILKSLKSLLRFEELYVDVDSNDLPERRIWAGLVKEFSHFKLYVNYIKGLSGDNTKDIILQLQCKW